MQTLIHQKTVSRFPALLPPPNFLFSQARKNHDLLRFRTKIGFKTLTLCSVASLPPLSYGGWEDFQLAGDSGESEMWAGPEGVHTLSSHGVRVAKTHMHDWLILVFLGSIILALNFIHPFHRFVGKDMMSDLKYPHKHNTTPFWNVVLSAVPLPVIVFLVLYLHQRDVYDLHHAILGILLSVMVTGVITDAIKDAVGCPRTFFW